MLSPHDRTSLFEALRPPQGYVLDAAVGTSFTLDLEAMLTAPIAFALHEATASDPEEGGTEPVGLLEAIRRHAERITLFCQAGQIAVPRQRRTVFAWLEDAVVEVVPPRPHGLFHPKVWLVRYLAADDDQQVLRVLCATRNLTFDTSWDTLLRVESEPYAPSPTGPAVAGQQELAGFFRALHEHATHTPTPARRQAIDELASDLERVELVPPEPFTALQFHSLGLTSARAPLWPADSQRALVISPFVSDGFVEAVSDDHEVGLLLSREESLDRLSPEVLQRVERLAVLNSAVEISPAEQPDDPGDNPAASAGESSDPGQMLAGLHAKLFVFDTDRGTRLFTGSANATEAAFDRNVEVLAELVGPPEAGVDGLLAQIDGETTFADLLADYRPLEQPLEITADEELELHLDHLRRNIAALKLQATVTTEGDDYLLRLSSRAKLPTLEADELEVQVWPVTLDAAASAQALAPGTPVEAGFGVTLEGITSFFAFRVRGRRGQARGTTTFLANVALKGSPDDRHSRLLAAMLRDPDRLLRYLLMLLYDEQTGIDGGGDGQGAGWLGRWGGAGWGELPLFELLLRALDRHPERLDHIDRLLADLGDERSQVLPSQFDAVWEPVWQHRQQGRP
jgi:hypothetical protein